MPLKIQTKRLLVVAVIALICLVVGGFVFVSYFMHAVYETTELLQQEDIPAAVQESFAKRFPGAADVVWEFEEDLYEAEFRWQGTGNVEAHFAADGTWSKTVVPVRFLDLPEKAQIYLKSDAGYDILEEERIERPESPPIYEAKLASKLLEWNCLFDVEGNLIAKTRDGPVLE